MKMLFLLLKLHATNALTEQSTAFINQILDYNTQGWLKNCLKNLSSQQQQDATQALEIIRAQEPESQTSLGSFLIGFQREKTITSYKNFVETELLPLKERHPHFKLMDLFELYLKVGKDKIEEFLPQLQILISKEESERSGIISIFTAYNQNDAVGFLGESQALLGEYTGEGVSSILYSLQQIKQPSRDIFIKQVHKFSSLYSDLTLVDVVNFTYQVPEMDRELNLECANKILKTIPDIKKGPLQYALSGIPADKKAAIVDIFLEIVALFPEPKTHKILRDLGWFSAEHAKEIKEFFRQLSLVSTNPETIDLEHLLQILNGYIKHEQWKNSFERIIRIIPEFPNMPITQILGVLKDHDNDEDAKKVISQIQTLVGDNLKAASTATHYIENIPAEDRDLWIKTIHQSMMIFPNISLEDQIKIYGECPNRGEFFNEWKEFTKYLEEFVINAENFTPQDQVTKENLERFKATIFKRDDEYRDSMLEFLRNVKRNYPSTDILSLSNHLWTIGSYADMKSSQSFFDNLFRRDEGISPVDLKDVFSSLERVSSSDQPVFVSAIHKIIDTFPNTNLEKLIQDISYMYSGDRDAFSNFVLQTLPKFSDVDISELSDSLKKAFDKNKEHFPALSQEFFKTFPVGNEDINSVLTSLSDLLEYSDQTKTILDQLKEIHKTFSTLSAKDIATLLCSIEKESRAATINNLKTVACIAPENTQNLQEALFLLSKFPLEKLQTFIVEAPELMRAYLHISFFKLVYIYSLDDILREERDEAFPLINNLRSIVPDPMDLGVDHEIGSVEKHIFTIQRADRVQILRSILNQIQAYQADGGLNIDDHDLRTMLMERGEDGYFRRRTQQVALGNARRNMEDVHRIAGLVMKPLFKWMNIQVSKEEIAAIKNINAEIIPMINNLTEENLKFLTEGELKNLSLEKIKTTLLEFLSHQKFIAALKTNDWRTVAPDATGEKFIKTAIALIKKHPEYEATFLIQGLWDAVAASIENPENLDDISCVRGIAERFVLWARDSYPFTLLQPCYDDILGNAKYQELFALNDSEKIKEALHEKENKAEFLARKRHELNQLRVVILNDLKQKHPTNKEEIDLAFLTKKITNLFKIFDQGHFLPGFSDAFEEAYQQKNTAS